MRDQRGAATPMVVACLSLMLALGAALGVVAAMLHDHRVAQSAADLAALAGAAALQRGDDGCAAAGSVAAANGARLAGCHAEGSDVVVRTVVVGPRWLGQRGDLEAQARAGPAFNRSVGRARAGRRAARRAPALSSGWFWLPHLGDWTHDGQPVGARAGRDRVAGGAQPVARPRGSRARRSRRRRGGRRRRRRSAGRCPACSAVETPPMSQRSQVANSGSRPIEAVLGGVGRARQVGRGEPGLGERRRRAPSTTRPWSAGCARAGRAAPRRSPRRHGLPALEERHDLVGDLDRRRASSRHVAPARWRSRSATIAMSVTSRAVRRVVRVAAVDHGDVVVEVERRRPARSRPGGRRPRPAWAVACGARRRRRCRPPGRCRPRPAATGAAAGRRGCRRGRLARPAVGPEPAARPPAQQPARRRAASTQRRAAVGPNSGRSASVQRQLLRRRRTGAGRARTGCRGRRRWPRPAGRTAPPGGAPGRCRAGRRGRPGPPSASPRAAPGAADLLPQRGAGAREAGDQHRVEPG